MKTDIQEKEIVQQDKGFQQHEPKDKEVNFSRLNGFGKLDPKDNPLGEKD